MHRTSRWLLGLVMGIALWAGALPVAAQKGPPPPTPAPATAAPTANTPEPKPVAPTPEPEVVKPTAPPTPTPEPTAMPAKPTAPPPTPEPTVVRVVVGPTTVPPTAVPPTVAPSATPTKALPEPLMPLPTATAVLTITEMLTQTTVVVEPHPVQVIVQQVQTRIAALPVLWQALGALLLSLVIVGGGYLVWRFLHYTRRDLHLKEQQIGEDAAARLAAHRREVEARLGEPGAWRQLTAQIIGDALHVPVRLSEAQPTLNADLGYFSVLAAGGQEYQLTIGAERQRRLKVLTPADRVVALPAAETQLELHAIWTYLVAEWLTGTAPVLPRQAVWQLVVKGKS